MRRLTSHALRAPGLVTTRALACRTLNLVNARRGLVDHVFNRLDGIGCLGALRVGPIASVYYEMVAQEGV